MENETLFSETEEALFNKIKRICNNMSNEIKGNDSMDNSSFNSFSGTFSLSTDALSNLSDISSIPTYQFSNPYPKKKEFHTPQIEKKKRRSKKPIYSPPTIKGFRSNSKSTQKNFECDCSSKTTSESTTNRSLHRKQKSIKSNKKIESHHPIQMNTYNYIEPSTPRNFLMPDLSIYSRVCICLFEGRNFPPSDFHHGERSTYAEFQLHPDVLPIQSPISHHHTKHCIYNGGYDISCQGLDFSNVIPIVFIYNYISPHERELLGISYIELHQPKKFNDKACIFLRNEWVNVYTINNHMKIGEVKLTLVFHTDDKDVSKFIILERRNQLENASNNSDDDFDFVVDSDEFINEVNEEIKKENQNLKKAIQVHPTNENQVMIFFLVHHQAILSTLKLIKSIIALLTFGRYLLACDT